MNDKYAPCPCGSGKKFKFCGYEKGASLRSLSDEALAGRAADFRVDQILIAGYFNWPCFRDRQRSSLRTDTCHEYHERNRAARKQGVARNSHPS
jgi:hypothetical protein